MYKIINNIVSLIFFTSGKDDHIGYHSDQNDLHRNNG